MDLKKVVFVKNSDIISKQILQIITFVMRYLHTKSHTYLMLNLILSTLSKKCEGAEIHPSPTWYLRSKSLLLIGLRLRLMTWKWLI